MRRFGIITMGLLALAASSGCGRSASGGRADAGMPDASVTDAIVLRNDAVGLDAADAGRADLGLDASMPPPPDVAGSDAVKSPLDGRDGFADDLVRDANLADARDAAADVAGPDVAAVDAPTTTNEIARACAMAASCSGYGSPTSTSRCIQAFGATASRLDDTSFDRLLKCWRLSLSTGSWGCLAFRQCWGGDLFTLDSMVQGAGCSGRKVVLTPSGATSSLSLDCGSLGQECVDPMTAISRAGCTAKGCLESPIAPSSCDGSVANACISHGLRSKVDCARSGRTCQMSGQSALCVGSGATCDADEKVTCAGSEATYCAGGTRATVDCATNTVATRCAEDASSTEPCTIAGSACNPSIFVDVCSGNGLQVCVDGSIATIPCAAIGLVSCATPNGASYARCQEGV